MQNITPHLWFDKEAKEAAEFYTSVFDNSKINFTTQIRGTPSGDCDLVGFQIMGYDFMAISAGPLFKINPSISFHVKCKTTEEVDAFWGKLLEGGTVLMELGEYPFSKRYGWIEDKYGVSWQVIFTETNFKQKITPVMMFTQDLCGKAEEAVKFYTSIFKNSKTEFLARYEKGESPVDKSGTIKYAHFILDGQEFGVMDSAQDHKFKFNEAISLLIACNAQDEIDYYWEKLSADPKAEQCGWVKDKFGLSWQVWPTIIGDMIKKGTKEQVARLIKAFLPMKKVDIEKLKEAYQGK